MNIFFLDRSPALAASYHHDRHVVKMCLETAQILSTAAHLNGVAVKGLYRPTHVNHPCVRWAAHSQENQWWLYRLAVQLNVEMQHRFGKEHKSTDISEDAAFVLLHGFTGHLADPNYSITPPALAMPDKYKTDDPVESYRRYYKAEKMFQGYPMGTPSRYTNVTRPSWAN